MFKAKEFNFEIPEMIQKDIDGLITYLNNGGEFPDGHIENLRSDMKDAGCIIDSPFRLHVTLGRVKASVIQLSSIQEMTKKVSLPAFSLTLLINS